MVGTNDRPHRKVEDSPSSLSHQTTIDRRELLVAVSSLAVLLGLPGVADQPALAAANAIDVRGLRDLTIALTGYSPGDAALPELFLEAFASDAIKLGQLHTIVRETPEDGWEDAIAAAGLAPLAAALVQSWYTGMIGEGPEERVLTYLDAFVWYACGYTKPPTRCDTNFGAWADAPPPGRFRE
jgi:hypothetical protein